MTVSAPWSFPAVVRWPVGGDKASWRPRTWWVGHLLLHRVEALTALVRAIPLDPLHRFVLRALAADATLDQLDQRLRLGRQFLGRLLHALQADGLVQVGDADSWTATDLGRLSLQADGFPRTVHERRSFFFTEPEFAEQSPHFLPLATTGLPWSAADWRFDVGLLAAALTQAEEWKRRFSFPLEVRDILVSGDESPSDWQRVVVDHPERLPIALVRTAEDRLLGFSVRQDGWVLQAETPAFTLDSGWSEVFPQLTEGVTVESARQVWQTWCQPRGLSGLGPETCPLEVAGHLLRVTVPPRLMERLTATRNDILKGEAWVLIGGSRLRPAMLLEVVEEGKKAALR